MAEVDLNTYVLSNGHVEVKIVPGIGGRVVGVNLVGKDNILKFNTAHLDEPVPVINRKTGFPKSYNGHIIWLGPQSEWWAHQKINRKRRRKKHSWPPDPYLVYGHYEIKLQSGNYLIMDGPSSPVTGMKLTKNVEIVDSNKVRLEVIAKNIDRKDRSWDIWFNTRLNGFDRCYVPLKDERDLRIQASKRNVPVDSAIIDGYFTFLPALNEDDISKNTKAFIYPDKPFIAAFKDDQMILIRFEKHDREDIHPEQALVEIYNGLNKDREHALLELEYHAPYKTNKPGEWMMAYETWEIFAYDGGNTPDEHIAFINQIINDDRKGK